MWSPACHAGNQTGSIPVGVVLEQITKQALPYLVSNVRRIIRRAYSGSSTGRASALQAEGCGFKSRLEYLGNAAQLVEQAAVNRLVAGSIPVVPVLGTWRNRWRRCLIRIRLRVRFPAFL